MSFAVHSAAAVTVLVLGFLVAYIVVRGVPNLKPSLFALQYTSDNQSMLPAIINTCTMTVVSLLLAVPFGVGAAIYLTEYARRGSRLTKLVQMTTQTLSGIPSIVYGLFGMLMFNSALQLGYSMLSGALTLAIMILPLAMPGILSGVILAIGRIVGETAALMYTSGTVAKVAGLMDSGTTLALHMYKQASEGLYLNEAYATSVVLLALVLLINLLSAKAAKLMVKGRG